MQVKICEGAAAQELEEKIQQAVDEMREKGFYLKHISYTNNFDYDNNYSEKLAIPVFDVKENLREYNRKFSNWKGNFYEGKNLQRLQ